MPQGRNERSEQNGPVAPLRPNREGDSEDARTFIPPLARRWGELGLDEHKSYVRHRNELAAWRARGAPDRVRQEGAGCRAVDQEVRLHRFREKLFADLGRHAPNGATVAQLVGDNNDSNDSNNVRTRRTPSL